MEGLRFEFGDIVDSHVHLWDPITTPRHGAAAAKYYARAPRLFEALFPLIVPPANRVFIRTPKFVGRPFVPSDYEAVSAGVGSFVHIEANWVGPGMAAVDETRWIWELCAHDNKAPELAGLVVRADPRDSDVGSILDAHMAACPRVVGVRSSAATHTSRYIRDWTDSPGVYASAAFLRGFAAIASRGLTFDAWVYDHQLDDIVTLASEYPSTTIVLDHWGTPVGLAGRAGKHPAADRDRLARWRDKLAELAALPNVIAKHSGIGMPILGFRSTLPPTEFCELMAPYVADVTTIFGADRVMFGSNTPMDSCTATFATIVSTVAAGVEEAASQGALQSVFRDTARRVYNLVELDERTSSARP